MSGPDFGLYFFGDYPQHDTAADNYATLIAAAQHADAQGYSSVWIPERHFHSFGGIFPNPSVLAAALAQATTGIRINAGSVVLPLHDPIRVAEEWSVVDNLSGGRVGIGCASGWNSNDFVFFPDRYGTHRELMYHQIRQVRRLWHGEEVSRTAGDGEPARVRLHPRPIQPTPPMFAAVVGRRESFADAARNDLGIITNLMTQDADRLAENIAYYRSVRAESGLDPAAGRVTVLLHTYLSDDAERARREAFEPLCSYMRSSLSLFGQVTNSLGFNIDMNSATEDDLSYLFERAYDRYCDDRALIGSPQTCRPIVETLYAAGVDEIAALVDFGVPAKQLHAGLVHLDTLRDHYADRSSADAVLSPGQQRMWLADQLSPGNNSQNEPKAFRLLGDLDTAVLRKAADDLVARHEALRTVYRPVDGEPRQLVLPAAPADFQVEDHFGRPEAAVVEEVIAAESTRRFDLSAGPLFIVRLLRLAADHHVLVLSLHHIAIDAVSARIITQDLSELYRAGLSNEAPRLPELHLGPRDFARRQLAAARSPRAAADLKYWSQRLQGELPTLRLPADRPRPAVQSYDGRALFSTVDAATTGALRRLGGQAGATLFMTLLAGLAATVRRFTGDDDMVIAVPISERPNGSDNVVGFFVNTLPLRIDASGDPDFAQLLARVRSTALDAFDHANVPFESVVRDIDPPRDTSRTPVFQLMAEYKHAEAFRLDLPGTTATPLDAGREVAVTDLVVHLINRGDTITVHTEYNTGLFDAATIQRILDHFHTVLTEAAADPRQPISRLAPLPDSDHSILSEWQHGPATDAEDTTLAELVAERAAADPEALAVVDGQARLTYGQLEAAARRRANWLSAAGVARGDVVGVWLPRSAELITTLLAIVELGAAYLPLDPSLGEARVRRVLSESRATALVVDAGAVPDLPDGVAALRLDPGAEAQLPAAPPVSVPGPDDRCYVIYTSGSTGVPKGVAVPHRALVNLCRWFARRPDTGPAERIAAVCGQSFDVSVLEIWGALTCGACLVIAPEPARRDPVALAHWFRDSGTTVALLPTQLGEAVMDLPAVDQPRLKTMMVGGDVLRVRPSPEVPYEVVNIYGPAETTVLNLAHTVSPDGGDPIDIGTPIDNTAHLVLDESGNPVPVGVVGELHIAGRCLADGYLHQPEHTARRFVTLDGYGRAYRTGDLFRWTANGRLQFHGRVDDQVKVRGFRVEPGEATHALRAVPGVAEAAVVAQRDGQGRAFLAGYIVAGPGAPADLAACAQRQLLTTLPEYLVPRSWATLTALPVNANGKLDRRALPAPRPANLGTAAPGSGGDNAAVDRLRRMWAQVLELPEHHICDDSSFFELGGHSLIAMRLLSRARELFGIECSTLEFYQDPGFAAMAARLEGGEVLAEGPASQQQFNMVGAANTRPSGGWNITQRVELRGDLNVAALRSALTAVIRRHQALRSRFVERDGEWRQQVLPVPPVRLPEIDLSGHAGPPQRAAELSAELSAAPMSVTEGHLLRTQLLRLAPDHWRLTLVIHHAVCDGWSVAILFKDLEQAYANAVDDKPAALPPAAQSIDYARWQLAHDDPGKRAENVEYWRKRLADTTFRVELPADRPAPEQPDTPKLVVHRDVPERLRDAVVALSRRYRCTPYAAWAAALGILVAEHTGIRRMALGTPYAARENSEHDSVMAILARVSILEVNAEPRLSFGELAEQVMRDYAEGIDRFVPLWPLASALAEDRGDEIPKLMPLTLAYQSSAAAEPALPGLTVTAEDVPSVEPTARTTVFVEPRPSGWTFGVICDGDRYDHETADGWLTRVLDILAAGTEHPDAKVGDLEAGG